MPEFNIKYIADDFMNHCTIKPYHYYLKKDKLCLINLLEIFEDVASKVNRGEPVDVAYLTFNKLLNN